MYTVAPSVSNVDEIIVDAYNRILQELANTKEIFSRDISRDFAKAMQSPRTTQGMPPAEPEKEEPEHGKLAASGSGYRYSRITKRFEPSENLENSQNATNARQSVSGSGRATDLLNINDLARQLEDVRTKNTALEIENRELRSTHPWDVVVGQSEENPVNFTARETIRHRDTTLNEVRARNQELTEKLRDLELRDVLETYTRRCEKVIADTHGAESQNMIAERAARFLEEALELAQACGMPPHIANSLVDYVFHRPMGGIHQEIGGVMVTLGGLAACAGLDMDNCGEIELKRCRDKALTIQAKGRGKPLKISPFNASRLRGYEERV